LSSEQRASLFSAFKLFSSLYLTAISAAAGHWLLGPDDADAQGSERAAWALALADGEPQGSGKAATTGAVQKSAACLVGMVATGGLGKAPHGSAGSMCALQGTSATGALPAADRGDKPVNQKSAGWGMLEVEGFRSMDEGVPMHPHRSSGTPASGPCGEDAASGNAGHEQDAADILPHGSAAVAVSALHAEGLEGS